MNSTDVYYSAQVWGFPGYMFISTSVHYNELYAYRFLDLCGIWNSILVPADLRLVPCKHKQIWSPTNCNLNGIYTSVKHAVNKLKTQYAVLVSHLVFHIVHRIWGPQHFGSKPYLVSLYYCPSRSGHMGLFLINESANNQVPVFKYEHQDWTLASADLYIYSRICKLVL